MCVRLPLQGKSACVFHANWRVAKTTRMNCEEIIGMDKRAGFRVLHGIVLLLAACVFHSAARAQTAEIRVDVSDSTGAVMIEVPVVVTNTDTGVAHSYKTDTAGLTVAP